ncbi:hypothetical protein JK364_00805 [Streptomyces sp. 110]|uniref:Transposase n=1 Tax=Streptomyces endocoffeicus TaxID=2898945 RepID=A0ABS1PF01_9ACTN|nr:hypothetical protein [Streptomyces endocoffeicus]MBL1110958.1 hypothetical protein [Streptomyces endocoffeicus]
MYENTVTGWDQRPQVRRWVMSVVVYKGVDHHNTTSFSAFDKPMDVRPPVKTDTLDASGTSR